MGLGNATLAVRISEYVSAMGETTLSAERLHDVAEVFLRPASRQAPARPLLFVHIPKTAGTSLLTALGNSFGDANILRLEGETTVTPRAIDAILADGLGANVCVAGHIPLYLMRSHLSRFRAFTLLRNPVARVFSLFRFLQRSSDAEKRRLGLAQDFGFQAFLNSDTPELVAQINNGMCRILGGGAAAFDVEMDLAQTAPDLLDQSIAALQRLDFGLAENLTASAAMFAGLWGLRTPLDIGVENATEGSEATLPPAALRAVVARNQSDLALYAWAQAEFPSRVAAALQQNAARVPVEFCPTLGEEVPVAAIAGRRGFHTQEPDGFSWLRSERPATIDFRATGGDLCLALRFYSLTVDYPMTAINLQLNGVPMAHEVTPLEPNWYMLRTGNLSLRAGLNRLTIDPPSFLSVRRLHPGTADDRYLSVALQSMLIA